MWPQKDKVSVTSYRARSRKKQFWSEMFRVWSLAGGYCMFWCYLGFLWLSKHDHELWARTTSEWAEGNSQWWGLSKQHLLLSPAIWMQRLLRTWWWRERRRRSDIKTENTFTCFCSIFIRILSAWTKQLKCNLKLLPSTLDINNLSVYCMSDRVGWESRFSGTSVSVFESFSLTKQQITVIKTETYLRKAAVD